MEKRAHQYNLTLEYVQDNKGETVDCDPIQLEFTNHDDIFSIVSTLKERNFFENDSQSTEFAIGLKLFTEVMLKNRKHPLFEAFSPAVGEFMKHLKASVKNQK